MALLERLARMFPAFRLVICGFRLSGGVPLGSVARLGLSVWKQRPQLLFSLQTEMKGSIPRRVKYSCSAWRMITLGLDRSSIAVC